MTSYYRTATTTTISLWWDQIFGLSFLSTAIHLEIDRKVWRNESSGVKNMSSGFRNRIELCSLIGFVMVYGFIVNEEEFTDIAHPRSYCMGLNFA